MSLRAMSIKSRVFEYGNEKESSWPPQFPEDNKGGHWYWDSEAGCLKEGYPPDPNPKFDTAPQVIFDSMPPTYHEKACRIVESRQEWERLDKETGAITFGSIKEPRKYIEKGEKEKAKELKQDRRRASLEALRKVRADPKEIRQKFQKEAEKQEEVAKKSGLTKLLKEAKVEI